MSEHYVCIHGHFYQPPRENPWLEAIERQESAHPYHDWNQRVTAECYAPNAASRILDERRRIVEIVNNYSEISFNFGPTLLSWMERNTRFTYEAILEADRVSQDRFDGHGSALAQAHGHIILPLANTRDKRTQIRWGIHDFEHRFGREPEGMWLPETAVDLESLDLMAEYGIDFTILAPHQAKAVRPLEEANGGDDGAGPSGPDDEDDEGDPDEDGWQDVTGGNVDPSRPYLVRLPSGRTITVFFYDGPVSRAVAFEDLLSNGERLANRLLGVLPEEPDGTKLVHIATDGETYGHHHTHGEMALSYALERIRETPDVELTNYGQFLERHPPRHEARIVEDSSWSCPHGIERWRSDCGCSTGAPEGWNQAWRAPLRDALDWLRDVLVPGFETTAEDLLEDPWEARDDYSRILLDRSDESVDAFLEDHAVRELSDSDKTRALKLLELQRHAVLMYTSCGWFFADISGIETAQVLFYAGRAVQLAEELFGESLEEEFLTRLEPARSNLPAKENGRRVYEESVLPARIDLPNVAAHFAIRSLFEGYREEAADRDGNGDEGNGEAEVYCYRVSGGDGHTIEVGHSKLHVGWARFSSEVTRESARLSYAAVHAGDHNVLAGVRGFQGSEDYRSVGRELEEAFSRGELPDLVRILDREYRTPTYSLRSLFRDEQQEILEQIFESSVREAETVLSQLYQERASLMRFVAELGIAQPRVFRVAAEFVLDSDLQEALSGDAPDLDRVEELLTQAREGNVRLDPDEIGYAARRSLERLADAVAEDPADGENLRLLERGVDLLLEGLDFEVNIWGAQNSFHRVLRDHYPERAEAAEDGEAEARKWVGRFRRVGRKLSVAVP